MEKAASANVEKVVQLALSNVQKGMANMAKNSGDKDGVLDISENESGVVSEGFSDFLTGEYGDVPTPDEIGEAVINWSSNYMMGDNDGDFDGVKGYMSNDVWGKIKDRVPSNFMSDLRGYAKNSQMVSEMNMDEMQYEGSITIKEDAVNEAIGALSGNLALSAPAIVQMAGRATKWLGKKVDANWLKKAGEALNHFGNAWHHKYEDLIFKAIKKLNPQADDKKARNAARAVLLSIVGTIAVASGIGAETGGANTGEVVTSLAKLDPKRISVMLATAMPSILKMYFEPDNAESDQEMSSNPAIA